MPQVQRDIARPLLIARGLRALADGCMAVLLPAWMVAIGHGAFELGVIATATLLGSALSTLAIGVWGHRRRTRWLLRGAALLMAATGLGFAGFTAFAPLLLVAFVGTLNPSAGDVSVFLPLEHARLAGAAQGDARTALFARYSVVGALGAAIGALGAGLPDVFAQRFAVSREDALRAMFLAYAAIGLVVWWLYRPTEGHEAIEAAQPAPAPLGPSRGIVVRLAALFSVDAFAGGLVVNAMVALWLQQRFGLSLAAAGVFFFWSGLLSAASQLAAPRVAARFGLLNTMVFTHIPSNLFLIAAALMPTPALALACLLGRAALSQMDVPTRTAYVMAVVTPPERPAAASFTAVPRSLAASLGPTLAAVLLAAGWLAAPLAASGVLKTLYDLALWRSCRRDEFVD